MALISFRSTLYARYILILNINYGFSYPPPSLLLLPPPLTLVSFNPLLVALCHSLSLSFHPNKQELPLVSAPFTLLLLVDLRLVLYLSPKFYAPRLLRTEYISLRQLQDPLNMYLPKTVLLALSAVGFAPLALAQDTAQQASTVTYTVVYASAQAPASSPVSSTPQPSSTPIPSSSSSMRWASSSSASSMATVSTQSVATTSAAPSSTSSIPQTGNAPAVTFPGALAAGIAAVAGIAIL